MTAKMPRPITADTVMRMATGYLAQRAASTAHLRKVLEARLRRRLVRDDTGPEAGFDMAPLLDDVLARLVRAGLLDDQAYAASRARSLAAKGLPAWRVARDLADKGIETEQDDILGALEPEAQARRYAERKRLGPHRRSPRPEDHEKDLRSLVRAGFSPRVARRALTDEEPESPDMNEQ